MIQIATDMGRLTGEEVKGAGDASFDLPAIAIAAGMADAQRGQPEPGGGNAAQVMGAAAVGVGAVVPTD